MWPNLQEIVQCMLRQQHFASINNDDSYISGFNLYILS